MAIFPGTPGDDNLFGTSKADTMDGGDGNDYLDGGAGSDLLLGGAGNDTMYGDAGADRFNGGPGNDFFWIGSNSNVRFTEAKGSAGGVDSIHSLITFSLMTTDRANIEGLELFGGNNVNATGNALNNFLAGNSGRNVLSGLGGNDKLGMNGQGEIVGLGGTDTTIGGPGNDLHLFDSANDILKEAAGGGNDTAGSANRTVNLGAFSNIENATLFGSADGLNLIGTTGKNKLTGNDGINILDGKGGADSLFAMGGNDGLIFDGKASKDVVIFDGGDGDDTILVRSGNLNLTGKGGGIFVSTEGVDLFGNRTVTLTSNDVQLMSPDSKTLTVTSDGGGILLSSDKWTFVENTTIDDNSFRVYESGGAILNVETGVDVSSLATQATPFDGTKGFFVLGAAAGAAAGTAVTLGDFDGDGVVDLAIGSPLSDFKLGKILSGDQGAVHLIEGRSQADFFSTIHNQSLGVLGGGQGVFEFPGPSGNNTSGSSLVFGDFNADGFDDFFTGGPGNLERGTMVLGSASPAGFQLNLPDGSNGAILLSPDAFINMEFGASVASGDFNGDRVSDFLIGAPSRPLETDVRGAAFGVFGGAGTELDDLHGEFGFDAANIVQGSNGFVIEGGATNAGAGRFLATGDFNSDGFDDVVLSYDANGKGSLVIAFGSATGPTLTEASDANGTNGVLLMGDVNAALLGGIRVAAGDVNGDGVADLVVAQSNSAGAAGNGLGVALGRDSAGWQTFHGATGATTADLDFFAFDPTFSGGVSVAVGDVDGDGNGDIVLGTPGASSGAGAVKIIRGGAETLEALNGVTNLNPFLDGFFGQQLLGQPGYRLGVSVAVGDVDGDGFADVVAGAPGNTTMPGGVGVFFGSNFANAVDFVGTNGADEMSSATADGQSYVGGPGSDLAPGGNFDGLSFHMGTGDDFVISNGHFRLLDGGGGIDTWQPSSSSALTGAPGNTILSIEQILLDQGNLSFTIDLRNLLEISRTTNTLTIDGDASDEVHVIDGAWNETDTGDYIEITTAALPGFVVKIQDIIGTIQIGAPD